MEEKNEIKNISEEASQPLESSTEQTSSTEEVSTAKTETKVAEAQVAKKPHKRILTGKVKSSKTDKTIVVAVETQVMHPLYKKYYKVTKKVMAHDEENTCNTGDTVKIKECRPLSARKRWILDTIVERAK